MSSLESTGIITTRGDNNRDKEKRPKKRTPNVDPVADNTLIRTVMSGESPNKSLRQSLISNQTNGTRFAKQDDQAAVARGIKRKIGEVDKLILLYRRHNGFYCWSQDNERHQRFAHHLRPVIMPPESLELPESSAPKPTDNEAATEDITEQPDS